MVTRVITLWLWIKIDPSLVVSGNLHFGRIPMIHVWSALVVFWCVIIVRIKYVGVIIEPLPIL